MLARRRGPRGGKVARGELELGATIWGGLELELRAIIRQDLKRGWLATSWTHWSADSSGHQPGVTKSKSNTQIPNTSPHGPNTLNRIPNTLSQVQNTYD